MRDPRLAITSRLRIVAALGGDETFPPDESGWPALVHHVEACKVRGIPYVLIDSGDLRNAPEEMARLLAERLGLPHQAGLSRWEARTGLQLCAPEVAALMSDERRRNDPFYRRLLGSDGIQPGDAVDWSAEAEMIDRAGLTGHVERWLGWYAELRRDPRLLRLDAAALLNGSS